MSKIIHNRYDLLAQVICDGPDDWSYPECTAAMVGMMDEAIAVGLKWGDDWSAIWPMAPDGWERVRTAGRHEVSHRLSDERDADARAAAIAAELAVRLDAHPDFRVPPNIFAVGVQGDYIVLVRPPRGKLSKLEAHNLAAWIMAMSDPSGIVVPGLVEAINES